MGKGLFVICVLLLLAGCSKGEKGYVIAVDPTWFLLEPGERAANLHAFSRDIVREVARKEEIRFTLVTVGWDQLESGLRQRNYDAILSSIHPLPSEKERYRFSTPYLRTGPVLLTRAGMEEESVRALHGKTLLVGSTKNEVLGIRLYPESLIRYFDGVRSGLHRVATGEADGMLLESIRAYPLVARSHEGKVVVATSPLDDSGLRLITLADPDRSRTGPREDLIARFDAGLKKIRKDGTYDMLSMKWGFRFRSEVRRVG
ncbi:MAG: transporter substrate-binding domain-containing protein [Simkaniaceae bacterium]|nr:transporter substrate-binding domain-containing protein [Simkaniaceae bacterium]